MLRSSSLIDQQPPFPNPNIIIAADAPNASAASHKIEETIILCPYTHSSLFTDAIVSEPSKIITSFYKYNAKRPAARKKHTVFITPPH